jgi:SAM-dependent methyltransferase
MKPRLLDWLACPACAGTFDVTAFEKNGEEVVEGLLTCACGAVFPIVTGIPRLLDEAFDLFPDFAARHRDRLPPSRRTAAANAAVESIRRTRESFGYQWTEFSEMAIDFRQNFLEYIDPVQPEFFRGKLGLDAGCGFGRHIFNAAKFGAEMVGVDVSAAIDSTRKNTEHLPNVHLVQADLYRLPFRRGVFDFAYSIGVLHHLPDPEKGFQQLVSLVRPGGSVFVWVYSKKRRVVNAILESVRAVTTRLPPPVQKAVSFAAAVVDWFGFVVPYRAISRLPLVGPVARRFALPRLKVYGEYPFQVAWADWFDRLAAPIRFYYNGDDLTGWLQRSRLSRTTISPTGLFGWRAYGERL